MITNRFLEELGFEFHGEYWDFYSPIVSGYYLEFKFDRRVCRLEMWADENTGIKRTFENDEFAEETLINYLKYYYFLRNDYERNN